MSLAHTRGPRLSGPCHICAQLAPPLAGPAHVARGWRHRQQPSPQQQGSLCHVQRSLTEHARRRSRGVTLSSPGKTEQRVTTGSRDDDDAAPLSAATIIVPDELLGLVSSSTSASDPPPPRASSSSSELHAPHPHPPPSTEPPSSEQLQQEAELSVLTEALPRQEARLEALALWVLLATGFGGGVWYVQGAEKAQEFFAGYLLEQSLSVDNLFVFVLVFSFFKTPLSSQPTVLSWGIGTAAVLRLGMILLGSELIQSFKPVLVVFALVLLWSAYNLLVSGEEDDDDDLSDNAVVKICSRLIPVSDAYDGDKFFTISPTTGATIATPLLLTLAVVELSDVLFAVDSIPAVFGVTVDPFIVYTSNMFAILSLRSLFAFVSTVMAELRFLDKAVALVLGFVGTKMLLQFADVDIPTDVSLLVVGLLLGGGVGASIIMPDPPEDGK